MSPKKRGSLIVLEGCDKSGKSSQSVKLIDSLKEKGRNCILLRFPDRSTPIGSLIDSYLQNKIQLDDKVIHHLFSANRWEKAETIKKTMSEGTSVLIDRYAYSGVAFSAAKKNMDLEWCKQPDVGLPRPDLVLFLDVIPEHATKRSGFGDERYENLQFQKRVYSNYLLMKDDTWQLVDAQRDFDVVHNDLLKRIEESMDSELDRDIPLLWVSQKTDTTK